ncbi:3'-5' exonuclease [Salinibacterium sp. NG253]|uniref:exonuclease domain-containing protein n=1 Tax=Salinibacterium sp. NG253 TaxID=2792039 RepID=UPI0018CF83BD|nr:exonuclease domain-containing protein [Salinibacterium sp. NG253]MBH0115465.1 3'-5' exonuclease [Salinibacterium sp. NG253]
MSNSGTLATFDLETTGVDVETSRIVSACIALIDGSGAVTSRWDWLADPGVEIPDGAAAIHGITTERARAEGRDAALVVAEIVNTLRDTCARGIPLVVYNAPYDLSLLDRECRRHSVDGLAEPYIVIDPLVIDKGVDRYRRGKRTLEATSALYGVALDDAHDAGADAIAAARVAQALLLKYTEQLSIPFGELHAMQQRWYAEQSASFQEFIRRSKGDESFVANLEWPVRSFPQ